MVRRAVAGSGWASTFPSGVCVFHGGLDEPRYDLEQRQWFSVEEVWPEEA